MESNCDQRHDARYHDPNTVVLLDALHANSETTNDGEFVGLLLPTVLDESSSGIGLLFDEQPRLVVGQFVQLTRNGSAQLAQVKNLRPLATGGYRLGLQWRPSSGDSP